MHLLAMTEKRSAELKWSFDSSRSEPKSLVDVQIKMSCKVIEMTDEDKRYWNETRYDSKEYEKRKEQILQNGILCKLQFQEDYEHSQYDPFYSLKVVFPPNFKHLIKPEAVAQKEALSSGFHISLGYRSAFNDNEGMLRELKGLWWKYEQPRPEHLKHVWIANSGTISIERPDPLYYHLIKLVKHGTSKAYVHISLD